MNFLDEMNINAEMSFNHYFLIDLRPDTKPVPVTRGFYRYNSADFSPDGKQLILAGNMDSLQHPDRALENEIYIVNTDGTKFRKVVGEKDKRYILNNWEGIRNLFGEEKYKCSAEGHISHILSDRLSSRPMGWSLEGADEMARMRAYKANGGSIKEYYRKVRAS